MKYNVPENTSEIEKYNYWNSTYIRSQERYCQLKDIYFWLSSNSDSIGVTVQRATGANPNNWVTIFNDSTFYMKGWSGCNYINFSQGTFGGGTNQTGNYWNYRIILMTKGVNGTDTMATSSTTSAQTIQEIRGYGDTVWGIANNYMAYDHIYSFDANQNTTFPANVTATKFIGSLQGNADTATKATQDSDGNAINTTYIKKSVLSGAYDIMYSSAANTPTRLAANTTSTKKFLRMTGTGSAGAAPVWDTVTNSDVGLSNVTNHQQVHEVAWDSTNKKITRSKNGSAGDVVQFVAGTNITLTAAAGTLTIASTNSDTLVKQTASTTTGEYKLLATASTSPTSGSAAEAIYNTNVTLNPSTNTITASYFVGNLTGNADSASSVAWSNVTNKPSSYYTLPLAANGTRGGIQIGYNESGNNYAVKLDSEKAYVTVPLDTKAPLVSPALTGTPTAPTATAGTNTTQIATTAFVMNAFNANDAMIFKGTLGATNGSVSSLPTNNYQAGWTYRIADAGTYAGDYCEVGDLIIAIQDGPTSGSSVTSAHWTKIEHNIDGAVYMGHAGSSIGSNTQPVYIESNGLATAITGSIANSTTGSAATLTTGRTLKVSLDSTNASTAFNGSADITDIGVSGILKIGNGGTGRTSWDINKIVYASAANTLGQLGHASSTSYLLKSGSSSAAPSWIQYTNSNTASTIVQRDANGDFSARNITATKFIGALNYTLNLQYDGTESTTNVSFNNSADVTFSLAGFVRGVDDSTVVTPSSSYLPLTGGTMTGSLIANASTSTRQVRNITYSTSTPTASDGSVGDIWIVYTA